MNKYIQKYTPKKSFDYIEHFKFTNDLKNYLLSNTIFDKFIICIGPSGCGKSSLVRQILKELNYTYNEIDINSSVNDIHNYLFYKSINEFFVKEKKLLLIDDFESFINDKHYFNNLNEIKLNNNTIPIICIVNKLYDRNKKYIDFKKKSDIFYLNKPGILSIHKHIIKILDNENIELNKTILDNIKLFIKNYKNNIKLILLNLDDLILNNLKKPNLCLNSQTNFNKFNDIGLYDIVNNLYNIDYSILELNEIIHTDSNLVCMLLHENLINHIEFRINKKEVLNNYLDIMENLSFADIVEKDIFTNNNWDLLKILYTIKIYKINKILSKKKTDKYIKNSFTQILTKYSLRCNYNKKRIQLLISINLPNNYFDFIIQNILYKIQSIYISENIDSKNNKDNENKDYDNDEENHENINYENLNKQIIKYYNIYDKDILNLIVKFNKKFEIIDNSILNKLKNN